ncbi:MAG: hypothetical protein HZA50_08495 [Planctomycetes bacterium]|nr:hypothetical protein [Planctomycetota bacterium]
MTDRPIHLTVPPVKAVLSQKKGRVFFHRMNFQKDDNTLQVQCDRIAACRSRNSLQETISRVRRADFAVDPLRCARISRPALQPVRAFDNSPEWSAVRRQADEAKPWECPLFIEVPKSRSRHRQMSLNSGIFRPMVFGEVFIRCEKKVTRPGIRLLRRILGTIFKHVLWMRTEN